MPKSISGIQFPRINVDGVLTHAGRGGGTEPQGTTNPEETVSPCPVCEERKSRKNEKIGKIVKLVSDVFLWTCAVGGFVFSLILMIRDRNKNRF